MIQETQQFIDEVVFNAGGSAKDLLTAKYTFVDSVLAPHYGFGAPGTGFTKTDRPVNMGIGLLAQGSILGGYMLFVRHGLLHYAHNFVGLEEHRITASAELTSGPHTLAFRFEKTGEHQGRGTLLVDGDEVGAGEIPRFTPTRFSITDDGLTCGYALGMPVVDDYQAPFRFTGRLHRVVVEVDGDPFVDPAAEADLSLRAQ